MTTTRLIKLLQLAFLIALVVGLFLKYQPGSNTVEEGLRLWQSNKPEDKEKAIRLWEAEADKGNLDAFVCLAEVNFQKDPPETKRLAHRAMTYGDGLTRGNAAFILGQYLVRYESSATCQEIAECYRVAANEFEGKNSWNHYRSLVRLGEIKIACGDIGAAMDFWRQAE